MWLFVLLGLNILMLGALYVLYRKQEDFRRTSLEIKKLSRRVDGLPGRKFEHEVNENIGCIADYLDDLDNRLNLLITASSNLRSDHEAVVEQTDTMLTISEELSGEIFSLKDAIAEVDDQIKTLDQYIEDLNEGNSIIEQGFYATVSSITKLQEAQKVTRDLLDATINSFEWDEDEIPTVQEEPVSEEVEIDLPEPTSLPPVSIEEKPPLVEPRKDGDPIITDLRAVPFEEAGTGGPDPYALGYTPDVEEWPTDFSSSNTKSSSRSISSRIRRLR